MKADSDVANKIMDLFTRQDEWRGIGKILRVVPPGAGARAIVKVALQDLVKQGLLQFNAGQRTYRLATYRTPQQRAAEAPKRCATDFVWPSAPGATLSENTAIKEYGLKHDEISDAAKAGKLHWLMAYAHGNPYNKLVRKEIEALALSKHAKAFVRRKKLEANLREVTSELRSQKRIEVLVERRKKELEERLTRLDKKPAGDSA